MTPPNSDTGMTRAATLQRLKTERFDLCVIGGGASGAGCALDAVSRGLNTALIEWADFGAATSGTSTKLVHGGVRYLEQAFKTLDPKQLSLVRKALHERKTLLAVAPHLAHPLALLTPCSSWFEGIYYTIGLKLYDWLAGNRRLQPSRWLTRREAVRYFPDFDEQRLHSAVLYYDGQFDDMRLNLALVQTAGRRGAAVANHVKAEQVDVDGQGRLQAVRVVDQLTGESFVIRASVFVNATGTRADFLRKAASQTRPERLRASKGAHVVLPATALTPASAALLIPKTADGRVLFAIPWRGHWLIGTTDTEAQPTDEPYLLPDEAAYLTAHVSQYLKTPLSVGQITGGFAGLRPLLQADRNAGSKSLVRDHEVDVDPQTGLVSILGGKWTTYRLMAEETIDACCRLLNRPLSSQTESLVLDGSQGYDAPFSRQFKDDHPALAADVADHLLGTYGTNASALMDLVKQNPALENRLVPTHPFIDAEVIYAVRVERAQTLPDILMRRIRLGLVDWEAARAALPTVAELAAGELGWTASYQHEMQAQFQAQLEQLILTAGLQPV